MNNQKKIAVILSGSGVYDGAEIHEATLTLYAIMKHNATYSIFAPDINQHHVINHITGKEMDETRNVLVESARIARGQINPLSKFNADEFDALIIPGGFGAAKNLSDFAFKGADCQVNEEVAMAIRKMVSVNKPIGALCIAPVLLSKVLGNVYITIGNDQATAESVEQMGTTHKDATHGEVVVDEKNKIVTSPCYMLVANIVQVAEGAENIVKKILELV